MTDKPLFSIITVVFNDVKKIEATIKSVLAQTVEDVEFIVVDGASTDGTVQLIEKYRTQIRCFISEKDSGIYDAMNKGIEQASGKYCLFLNSGDMLIDPNILAKVKGEINNEDIIYGDVITVNTRGERNLKKAGAPENKHRMYFCHQSTFAKTDLMKALKFDQNYKMSADFKFIKTCYYQNKSFHQLDFPICEYDLSGISKTSRVAGLKENLQVIAEVDRGWERIRLFFRIAPSYWVSNIRLKIKTLQKTN